MVFEFWPALVAGMLGGALMTVMRMLLRMTAVPLRLNVPRLWSTMVRVHGTAGRAVGLAIHIAGSGLLALFFAGAFALADVSNQLWLWGLLGGSILWVIAGLFMGIIPMMHPEIPARQPAPGFFVMNCGVPDVVTFFVGHLIYGVVVGIVYALFHSSGGLHAAF